MKRPSLATTFGTDESNRDDQLSEELLDALAGDDKVVEIRPANRSTGMTLGRLLLLGAGVVGLAYWVRRSQKPDEFVESVTDATVDRTHEAAETIEAGSETASDRIEAGSSRASDAFEEAGESIDAAGDEVAERTEEAGERAADEADGDESGFSGT